jgi:hypothetical protein
MNARGEKSKIVEKQRSPVSFQPKPEDADDNLIEVEPAYRNGR